MNMEFLIKSIEKKQKYPRNKYHTAAYGRECDIVHLVVGQEGKLVVDMIYDPGYPHRYRTTTVLRIENLADGTIIFETENSVYTLTPTKKGFA